MEFTKPAPYEYKPFTHRIYKSLDRVVHGYTVTMYYLFDGKNTYSFRTQSDMLENALLLKEMDVQTSSFMQQFVVTSSLFPEIWKEIQDYEDVLKSNTNKEHQLW